MAHTRRAHAGRSVQMDGMFIGIAHPCASGLERSTFAMGIQVQDRAMLLRPCSLPTCIILCSNHWTCWSLVLC